MTAHPFTPQQEDIFAFAEKESAKNGLIIARAGAGKSSTLVELVERQHKATPSSQRLCLVFGKDNAQILRNKLHVPVPAKTFHALGYSVIRENVGDMPFDEDQRNELLAASVPKTEWYVTKKALSLAKNMLLETPEDIIDACDLGGVEYKDADATAHWVLKLLNVGKDLSTREAITNDDLIWLPHVLKLDVPEHAEVFLDEGQDTNKAQFSLLRRCLGKAGRLIAVADPAQAIFAWRGADRRAVEHLRTSYSAKVLPLSVSFRCCRAVIREAQRFAPDIVAMPDAPEGKVRRASYAAMIDAVEYGDYVLSRTNAPLVRLALQLLAQDCRVTVAGKEGLGESLLSLLRTFTKDAGTPSQVLRNGSQWLIRKRAALSEDQREAKAALDDKLGCLTALLSGARTVEDALQRARTLFSPGVPQNCVTLSTAHRAKGLERDRVFMLKDTFRGFSEEERNIEYVAITRARNELVYVEGDGR